MTTTSEGMMTKTIDFGIDYDVLDEITVPGMKARLVQSHKTKSLSIQSWGYMSNTWITTQRYKDVREMWANQKALATKLGSF